MSGPGREDGQAPDPGAAAPPPERRRRRPPLDERAVWRRWLWGGIVVILIAVVGSLRITVQGGPEADRPPEVPHFPEAVAMDDPLLAVDVQPEREVWLRLLALEDGRARGEGALEELAALLESPSAGIRRAAVRALGRLERPDAVSHLGPALSDPDVRVRIEAANALAQAAFRGEGVGDVRDLLVNRLHEEEDPGVQGALARSLGRLRVGGAPGAGPTRAELEDRAMRLAAVAALDPDTPGGTGHDLRLLGVARGALFLFRSPAARGWEGEGREALVQTLEGVSLDASIAAPAREAAGLARAAAGAAPPPWTSELLASGTPELRRVAATLVAGREALERALSDRDATVRVEGVRGWARHMASREGCAPLLRALDDPSHHVALEAVDALGRGICPGGGSGGSDLVVAQLEVLAGGVGELRPGAWHRPVRALGALARLAPERARPLLSYVVESEDPFVRAHAARIAGTLADEDALRTLVRDPSANVRQAAIAALVPLAGRSADPVLVEQLAASDPQLVQTAARLLGGSAPTEESMTALFGALGRFTDGGRATDRDPRVALLERIAELGDARDAPRLERWLEDGDPRVAAAAAAALLAWTGEEREPPAGPPLAGLPLPGWDELRELHDGLLELVLEGGGLPRATPVRIRMLPLEAPASAARVVRLAREGELDGLTLHRVVANFVVQGGSPGANEYAGHGAYTRDELGRVGHWAGTVGVSTRGRDTGDGQLFVNLVHNLRLDHDYTVFGVVVEGMEAVAAAQEGVTIREARWLPRGAPGAGGEG
jgi:cyclophilin family peptidyl-prolyl cis-trans isomerase/HEAT repeat protein